MVFGKAPEKARNVFSVIPFSISRAAPQALPWVFSLQGSR